MQILTHMKGNLEISGITVHALSSHKKRFIRNDTMNFGPIETQTLRSYFLKKREPQSLRKKEYFWQKI